MQTETQTDRAIPASAPIAHGINVAIPRALMHLRFPRDAVLTGVVCSPWNSTFVTLEIEDGSPQPFATFEVGLQGALVSGDYHETRTAALASMVARAYRLNDLQRAMLEREATARIA